MNNFVFYSPTEFVFGKDTDIQTGTLAKKYNARKAMIVYGGGSIIRSGLLQRIEDSLQQAGVDYVKLGGVQPNPTDPKVYEGIELARKEGVDFMLPVGGGSVIDTAKAIAAGVPYEGDFWDFYIGKAKVKKALKVGVVLTIPAAGSEGSGNTVITKLEGLQKLSLRVPELLRPVFAVMNPELTYTLPPYQTACGIADMMVHIMERYFTNTPDVEISDRLCEGTLMAIIKEAYKVKQNPNDYEARANIMWCGTIAHNGTCGVGCEEDWASHFLEHEISAVYNVTHGAGLAVIVPAWMTFMAEHNPKKIARFANRVFGVPENEDLEEMALAGISRLKHFFRSFVTTLIIQVATGSIAPILTLYVRELAGNVSNVAFISGMIASVPGVAALLSAPRLGKLGDRIGPEKILITALIFSVLLLIPMSYVQTPLQLGILRFLLGAADGALLPAVQTLLVYNSSNQIAGRIFSYNQSFRDIGNVTGPLMGAAISANYGFRAVFLVTAGVVLFNAVYSWNSLRRRRIPQISN